jgi:hypothetical protein
MIKLKKLLMESLLEADDKLPDLPDLGGDKKDKDEDKGGGDKKSDKEDDKSDDEEGGDDKKEDEKIIEPIDSKQKSVKPVLYNEVPTENTAFKSVLTLLISQAQDSNKLDGLASSLVKSVFNIKNKESFDSFLKNTQSSFGDIPGYMDLVDKMKTHIPNITKDNNSVDTDVNISEVLRILKEMKNPCWNGYEMVGMKKKKKNKKVPNCVPKLKEMVDELNESKCTKVTKKASSTRKDKKWMKCAKQSDGSIKRIHWGDPNAKVTGKSGNTKRKKNFRARHDCKNAKPGTPKSQACKDWE